MLAIAAPAIALRLGSSDAANDPPSQTTHKAYELLAEGFGAGLQRAAARRREVPSSGARAAGAGELATCAPRSPRTPGVASVVPPRLNPAGDVATITVYPRSSPQAYATTPARATTCATA